MTDLENRIWHTLNSDSAGLIADHFTDVFNYSDIIPPEEVMRFCFSILEKEEAGDKQVRVLDELAGVYEIQGLWDYWQIEWGTAAITFCNTHNLVLQVSKFINHPSFKISKLAMEVLSSICSNSKLFLRTDDHDYFKINLRHFDPRFTFGEQEITQMRSLIPQIKSAGESGDTRCLELSEKLVHALKG